ncbi:MAG TPA: Uma2 family endonuclease [Phaeodactylibacter sp.]|nr:Uma2 family endonuclease [Phaeodactylibacter sp.]
MEVATQIPLRLEERLKLGTELRMPASWEEFLEVLPKCEYQVEYYGGEIVSIMGQASDNHELLVATIIQMLGNLLDDDFYIYSSNLPIQATGTNKHYFNADCTVVKGQSEKVQVLPGVSATTNPNLLVEVLSPSTQQEDLSTKLIHYRAMPSVQQLLFIDSTAVKVTSYTRLPQQGGWLLKDFTEFEDRCPVFGEEGFLLKDLYKKVNF